MDEAPLAHPRLTDGRRDLVMTVGCPLLRAAELLKFGVAADKACQPAPRLPASPRRARSRHLVDLDRVGEPLHRHGPKRLHLDGGQGGIGIGAALRHPEQREVPCPSPKACPARSASIRSPRIGMSRVWGVLVQGERCSGAVVVDEIAGEDAAQVRLAEHEDVLQTFATDRADETFREGLLPRTTAGRPEFSDPQALQAVLEGGAVDLVTIVQEIGRRGGIRERVDELVGGSRGGGVLGNVEVNEAAATRGEDDECARWMTQSVEALRFRRSGFQEG